MSRVPASGSRREILALAWPIGVSMVSMTLKQFIDMLMVGSLGTDSLAAVGLGGILAFNFLAFPVGLLRSQKPLISQYHGAGDRATSLSFGAQAFWLALGFGALSLLAALLASALAAPLAAGTGMDALTLEQFRGYLTVRLSWAPPYLLAMAIAEYQRAMGRTRLPMAADLIAHPLNVLFNWLLIFGRLGLPALGVRGAALGTGLADCASLLLLLVFSRPGRGRPVPWRAFRLSGRRLTRALSVGTAGGVQFVLEVGSFTLVTLMVAHLGTVALAAHQAAISILHVSWLPGMALGDGGAVLIGRYVGEKRWHDAERTFRSALSMVMAFMLCMGLIFILFGEALTALFLKNDDPAVQASAVALGGRVMIVAAFWQFFDALQIVFRFSLRATGDYRWVMWVGILCSWLLSVPLVYAAVFWLRIGLPGAWALWSVEIVAGAWIFSRRWRSGIWRKKRLVRAGDAVQAGPPSSGP